MIINFQFENWSCYRNETCLSMQAGPERYANLHLARFGMGTRYEKLLPVVAIYGNNAAGKTQLVRAIDFVRHFAIGDYSHRELPYEPFLLEASALKSPTRFVLQFLSRDSVFEYELELRMGGIEVEKLSCYSSENGKKLELFTRIGGSVYMSDAWGGKALGMYAKSLHPGRTQSLLALSHDLAHDLSQVSTVYNWFAHRLFIITPDVHYSGLEDFCSHGVMEKMTVEYLDRFDIGIKAFEPKVVDPSALPPDLQKEILMRIRPHQVVRVRDGMDCYWVRKGSAGRLHVQKVFALHDRHGEGRIPFPMSQESDGTRRMIDLIPAFSNLEQENSENVYVVDELDRSLHHAIARNFVEEFLSSRTFHSRSQLIFTTHDLMLMDQDVLRRDSMYIVDKSPDGESSLSDLRQFKGLRHNTNIREKYLEGRFGGIATKAI